MGKKGLENPSGWNFVEKKWIHEKKKKRRRARGHPMGKTGEGGHPIGREELEGGRAVHLHEGGKRQARKRRREGEGPRCTGGGWVQGAATN